jgi:hypothetical protein
VKLALRRTQIWLDGSLYQLPEPARPVASDIFDVQRFRNTYLLRPDKTQCLDGNPRRRGWQWIMVEILVSTTRSAKAQREDVVVIDQLSILALGLILCSGKLPLIFDRGSHLTALPRIAGLVGGGPRESRR